MKLNLSLQIDAGCCCCCGPGAGACPDLAIYHLFGTDGPINTGDTTTSGHTWVATQADAWVAVGGQGSIPGDLGPGGNAALGVVAGDLANCCGWGARAELVPGGSDPFMVLGFSDGSGNNLGILASAASNYIRPLDGSATDWDDGPVVYTEGVLEFAVQRASSADPWAMTLYVGGVETAHRVLDFVNSPALGATLVDINDADATFVTNVGWRCLASAWPDPWPDPVPPEAPANLEMTFEGGTLEASWDANPDADHYRYRICTGTEDV